MNKVAQRLRDRNTPYGWVALAETAADEIDRLEAKKELIAAMGRQQAEIERLNRVVIRGLAGVELSEENDRLIAEIERLQQQIVHLKRTIDVMKAPGVEG